MKIGFDAKRLFRNYTGLGNYSRTLVGNLSRFCPQEQYLLFAEKLSDNAEAAPFIEPPYEVVKPRRKFLWRAWRIDKDIERQKIDLYHGLSHDLPIGIGKTGAKTVVTIHDVCYRTFPAMFPLVERLIYAFKYRHSCRVADRIIAISQSTKTDLMRYFGVSESRIEVIYQAINPVFYTPIDMVEARKVVDKYGIKGDYVLYVGSINERKNLLGVIRAYAQMDETHRLPLVVIGGGGGGYFAKCMAEAEKLEVSRHITRLEGMSSMQALQAFYTAAKVMVYPSFYEGFGLPVAEALLSGCPVVTSNVSSLPEAGGDGAIYVDPKSEVQIARAIEKLLDNRELSVSMVEKGRAYVVDKFDPERLTLQTMNLYKKLCK